MCKKLTHLYAIALFGATLLMIATVKVNANDIVLSPNCEDLNLDSKVSNGEASSLSMPLKILSWNIRKSSMTDWYKDFEVFSQQRNLILLQEGTQKLEIPTALEHLISAELAQGYKKGSKQTGVMTLSSSTPIKSCFLSYQEPWLRSPKTALLSWFSIAGEDNPLLTINLHSVNFAFGTKDFAAQLSALSEMITRHKGPLIIAGDFNTWSKERLVFLQRYALQHRIESVSFDIDERTTIFKQPIDHIFYRDLIMVKSKTLKTQSSDHNPLFAEFESL